MSSTLFGKWKLGKSEMFEEYMKAVGVNYALRKAAAYITSTTEIIDLGDNKVRINTQSLVKSSDITFPVGEAITQNTMDGRTCQTVMLWVGDNKMRQTQTWKVDTKTRTSTIDFVLENDGMTSILECDGVVCKRFHTRC